MAALSPYRFTLEQDGTGDLFGLFRLIDRATDSLLASVRVRAPLLSGPPVPETSVFDMLRAGASPAAIERQERDLFYSTGVPVLEDLRSGRGPRGLAVRRLLRWVTNLFPKLQTNITGNALQSAQWARVFQLAGWRPSGISYGGGMGMESGGPRWRWRM